MLLKMSEKPGYASIAAMLAVQLLAHGLSEDTGQLHSESPYVPQRVSPPE